MAAVDHVAELQVDPRSYIVTMKVISIRFDGKLTREACIKSYRRPRKDKMLAVGQSFDTIHSKGLLREAENAQAQNTRTQLSKGKKDRKTETMKAEQKYNQELKRRERLRLERIVDEVNCKVEVSKVAKRAAKEAAATKARPATTGGQENTRTSSVDATDREAPLTPPH